VTVLFALLAALANAFSAVAQHRASAAKAAGSGFLHVTRYLVTNVMWLLGAAGLIGAFVFQALALHDGLISVVQALLVTELVFALVLRRWWIHQVISKWAWASAGLTCAGLALFIVMAEPEGGHATPTSGAWLSAIVTVTVVAAGMTGLAQFGTPGRRAGLYATAAGLVWALEATFIKATTDTLASSGLVASLGRWPIYALVVGGIVGSILTQAALHVGPLRVSQPLLVAVDPFVSIFLGLWIFGEHFTDHPGRVVAALIGFVVMVVGIVAVTSTAPPDMEPSPSLEAAPPT
jgi:drug/metabolite transporter (DMT)-like permease